MPQGLVDKVRLAVIGAGDIAVRHAEGLRPEPGVEIVAVAEPDERRRSEFARRYGLTRAVADFRALLDDPSINTLLVLTPHNLHEPVVVQALKAGKHVICEKPMARNLAECDSMLAAAASSDRSLFITHTLRVDHFFLTARRAIAEGRLGRVLGASFRWFTDEIARLDDPGHWKGTIDRSGGGVFIDGGCHVADLGNALLGRARRVAAFGSRLIAKLPDRGEDNGGFLVEYESGATATFLLSFTAGSGFRGEHFAAGMNGDFYGTDGHIEGGYLVRDTRIDCFCTEHRPGGAPIAHPTPPSSEHTLDPQFVRTLLRGDAPPLTAIDARNAVAVVEAAYRSRASGRVEEVHWRTC